MTGIDKEKVDLLIRQTAQHYILPRFQSLEQSDIEEKAKGDFVTIVDRQVEAILTPELANLAPAAVLGEEATAADPTLLKLAEAQDPLWIIDPIDGTANFIDGKPGFGVMVAYVDKGAALASWIYLPVSDRMYYAGQGEGAWLTSDGGQARLTSGKSGPIGEMVAGFITRKTPEPWASQINSLHPHIRRHEGDMASALEYSKLASGEKDIVTYYRMLPWDHVPGSLLLREAGGVVRSMETGKDYRPGQPNSPHLLARDEESWQSVSELIIKAGEKGA